MVIILAGTVGLLLWTINPSLPYEEDMGSKTAKVYHMVQIGSYLTPLSGAYIYRDELFSLYYLLSAIGYGLVRGDPTTYLNYQSLVAGVLFMGCLAYALRRAYRVHYLVTWLVFISMPVIVLTFTDGNEVAFSSLFAAAALALIASPWRWGLAAGGVCYGLSWFCRPDMMLIAPFVGLWAAFHGTGDPTRQARLRRFVKVAAWTAGTVLVYWLIFLRAIPNARGFPMTFDIKLFLAILTYPFNITVVLLGGGAMLVFLVRDRRLFWTVLPILVVLAYYAKLLGSPKYIFAMAFFFGIPAAVAIQRLRPIWKAVAVAAVAFWWFVSVSIYGVYGPDRGWQWTIPTYHGQVPTGSYLTAYQKVHQGFYQEQYRAEIAALGKAMDAIQQDGQVQLVGSFNNTFFHQAVAYRGRLDLWHLPYPGDIVQMPDDPNQRVLMIRRGYLTTHRAPQEFQDQLSGYLLRGQVTAIGDGDVPLPDVIEIGPTVPVGTDTELGQRILFAQQWQGGQGAFPTQWYLPQYKPLCWMSRWAAPTSLKAVYADEDYVAFAENVPGGTIFRTQFPFVYYKYREHRR
jgi:hypothetical protein